MNIGTDGRVISTATKELSLKWQQTKDSWRDAKSQEFEQKYMDELIGSVDRAVAVLDQLDKVVARIRSECE
jgi:hypothetical protein